MNLEIYNKAGKLKLNDVVHKDSADKLIDELGRLYGQKAVDAKMQIGEAVCIADEALESVEVEINSPGGSVLEGQRIYSALREMAGRGVAIKTHVNGMAASMGSVILMAGDERTMTHGSRIMIHEASTISWGDARTMKRNYELLEGMSDEIAGIYAARTDGDKESIRNMMYSETWMDASKAKELGFVHSVIKYDIDKDAKNSDTSHMSILARLFPDNDQVAQLEAQVAENDSLRNEIAEMKSQLDAVAELQNDILAKAAMISELTTERDEVKAQLDEAASKVADLEAKSTPEAINLLVIDAVAQAGHAPIEVEGSSRSETKSVLEIFNDLKGGEATEFYRKNRKAILEAQSKLSN
jgi:ATP-dependent protease ClpP protease subunit